MDKLRKLLDPDTLVENFTQIANELMNNMLLNINGHKYQIIELEFYVYSSNHRDVFTHCDENQKSTLKWYFHRSSDKNKYAFKNGTYKGLDIAIGNDDIYGGILLRSLQKHENSEIINGSCKVVDEILLRTECKTVKDLVKDMMKDNTNIEDNKFLTLEKRTCVGQNELFTSPRVGLTLKNQENIKLRHKYISKLYRYMILPNEITKGKKLVLLTAIDNKSKDIVKKYFGLNDSKISEYKKVIDNMKNKEIDISDYHGKILNEKERMELFFNSKD